MSPDAAAVPAQIAALNHRGGFSPSTSASAGSGMGGGFASASRLRDGGKHLRRHFLLAHHDIIRPVALEVCDLLVGMRARR